MRYTDRQTAMAMKRINAHVQRLNNLEAEGFTTTQACNILAKEIQAEGFILDSVAVRFRVGRN